MKYSTLLLGLALIILVNGTFGNDVADLLKTLKKLQQIQSLNDDQLKSANIDKRAIMQIANDMDQGKFDSSKIIEFADSILDNQAATTKSAVPATTTTDAIIQHLDLLGSAFDSLSTNKKNKAKRNLKSARKSRKARSAVEAVPSSDNMLTILNIVNSLVSVFDGNSSVSDLLSALPELSKNVTQDQILNFMTQFFPNSNTTFNNTIDLQLNNVVDYFNLVLNTSGVTESDIEWYSQNIPNLLLQLTNVNSTQDVLNIINPFAITQLANYLNDSSLQNSTTPFITAAKTLARSFMNSPQFINFTQSDRLQSILERFTNSYLDSFDLDSALDNIMDDLTDYLMDIINQQVKELMQAYYPSSYDNIKDQSDLAIVLAELIWQFEEYFNSQLREIGIPIQQGSTTTTATTESTTTEQSTEPYFDPSIYGLINDISNNDNYDGYDYNYYGEENAGAGAGTGSTTTKQPALFDFGAKK